jgi:AbrB family looped-hinge helix DNA binding protein
MKQSATLTSKGQVTIPVQVRRALDLHEGDQIVFEVEEGEAPRTALMRPASDIFAMAASIKPRRQVPRRWDEERRIAREDRARRRRR